MLKVSKSISGSLENNKIITCIVLSIILNYIISNIKLWMILCIRENINKSVQIVPKSNLLYNVLF